VRYELKDSQKEDPYGVMVSAFRNADGTWAVVAINYGEESQPLTLSLSDGGHPSWTPYRTSDADGETLKPLAPTDGQTTLTPRSITTFVSR
jgi:hypothetical protein